MASANVESAFEELRTLGFLAEPIEGRIAYASELKPGDYFQVTPRDPEGPIRICLTNDAHSGIRWGFPDNARFWCSMGDLCLVLITVRP